VKPVILVLVALLTACTGSSTPDIGPAPSPAAAFFDPCPTATGEVVDDGLPDIELSCLGRGPKVRLSGLRGPLLVNVWASWCLPCREETPLLQGFYAKAKGKVAVLGIDYNDSDGSAQDFAGHYGVTYPSVVGQGEEVRGHRPFVFTGLPMTVLVDAAGKVVHVERSPFTEAGQIEALVREHLGVSV
jgi:thiol-disulfide isomerase/thioredoxin